MRIRIAATRAPVDMGTSWVTQLQYHGSFVERLTHGVVNSVA